jgi:hypothetical protein
MIVKPTAPIWRPWGSLPVCTPVTLAPDGLANPLLQIRNQGFRGSPISDHLPADAVIIGPAEIIDLISITKWALLGGEISGARGRRAKERLGHYREIFWPKKS